MENTIQKLVHDYLEQVPKDVAVVSLHIHGLESLAGNIPPKFKYDRRFWNTILKNEGHDT